jgi:predicted acyl esterase
MYKMFLPHSLSEMKPEDDRFLPRLSLILVLALAPMWCVAQTIPGATVTKGEEFHLYEVMVPMRDSKRLQSVIMVPKDQNKPLPFLLSRSPYGVPDSGQEDRRIAGL